MTSVPRPSSYSSSPSNPSLRTQRSLSRTLHTSPYLEDAAFPLSGSPNSRTFPCRSEDEHAIAESSEFHETSPAQINEAEREPRPFLPFFTLVHDTSSNTTHHPTVHYVFADDEDAEIVTEAALRGLEGDDPEQKELATQERIRAQQEQEDEPSSTIARLARPRDDVREHHLIVDIDECPYPNPADVPELSTSPPPNAPAPPPCGPAAGVGGYTVHAAHSLSAHWQILTCTLSPAPTLDGAERVPDAAQHDRQNLMLRIEGLGVGDGTTKGGAAEEGEKRESLEERLERLEKGLGEIRRVIDGDVSGAVGTRIGS